MNTTTATTTTTTVVVEDSRFVGNVFVPPVVVVASFSCREEDDPILELEVFRGQMTADSSRALLKTLDNLPLEIIIMASQWCEALLKGTQLDGYPTPLRISIGLYGWDWGATLLPPLYYQ